MKAHARTKHRTMSLEQCMVNNLCRSPFFLSSKVIVAVSAKDRHGLLCLMNRLFFVETEVKNMKGACFSFFLCNFYSELFVQPHCKKYCANTQLSNCNIFYCGSIFEEYGEYDEGQ